MAIINKKPYLTILLILIFCFVAFFPGFTTYFHQDDFIMFYYSQSFAQVARAFNIFARADFPFYRPIPTQLYFFVGQKIFGFNPLGYHIFNFLLFCANVILVYKVIQTVTKNINAAIFGTLIFAVNTTHFAPLYAASYAHELFFVFFGSLTALYFCNNKNLLSVIFFIFALMSKETAVVLPGIIALIFGFTARQFSRKRLVKILIPYVLILSIYLWAHFVYYGIPESSSYKLMLGKSTLNALIWYFAWGLSAPNIFIDFLERGFHIRPVFYDVTGLNGHIFVITFPVLLFLLLIAAFTAAKNNWKTMMFGYIWFVVGLIPILIFPLHKLAIEQAFPLVGLALASGVVIVRAPRLLGIMIMVLYLVISVNSAILASRTHWIVRSALQAKNTVTYLQKKYPHINNQTVLYFKNGQVKIPEYGSSRQIYYALGEGKGLPIILGKPNLKMYFEDLGQKPASINKRNIIDINSSDLLGY